MVEFSSEDYLPTNTQPNASALYPCLTMDLCLLLDCCLPLVFMFARLWLRKFFINVHGPDMQKAYKSDIKHLNEFQFTTNHNSLLPC
jgi:hypothetical protein